jgi:hypothetical protein
LRLAVSVLFSWYAEDFGSYNKTYGSLGAVVGFMVWMWLSTIVILLGAEIDAEMEHQRRETPPPVGRSRWARAAPRWPIPLARRKAIGISNRRRAAGCHSNRKAGVLHNEEPLAAMSPRATID